MPKQKPTNICWAGRDPFSKAIWAPSIRVGKDAARAVILDEKNFDCVDLVGPREGDDVQTAQAKRTSLESVSMQRKRPMAQAAQLAIWGAVALSVASAFFGVAIARMVWADDLKQAERHLAHAEKIKTISDQTIASMSRTIEIQKRRLGE